MFLPCAEVPRDAALVGAALVVSTLVCTPAHAADTSWSWPSTLITAIPTGTEIYATSSDSMSSAGFTATQHSTAPWSAVNQSIVSVSLANKAACALTHLGEMACWGDNSNFQAASVCPPYIGASEEYLPGFAGRLALPVDGDTVTAISHSDQLPIVCATLASGNVSC